MKRNKRLLLKAAKRIEEVPQSYEQDTFCASDPKSPCGVVACLAGEIIIASERSTGKGVAKLRDIVTAHTCDYWHSPHPADVAKDLVGLNASEADIFSASASWWPQPFRDQWYAAKTYRGKASAAARLLRYLAEGGKV